MIKVIVKTNTVRGREVTADAETTPAENFADLGVSVSGTSVNLDGVILTATDLNSSLEALGIHDGATVNLNSVIKADGALR